jgi:hypothetical protein
MKVQLGSVAEWVGAIATFSAVVVALYFSLRQSTDRKKREDRDQAVKVSAWPVTMGLTKESKVVLSNTSSEPIYDVVISYGVAYGAGQTYLTGNENLIFIKRVPPGRYVSPEPKNPGGAMHTQTGIAISFRDANGKYWRRDATGKVIQTRATSFVELEVEEPISDWTKIVAYND